MCTIQHAQVGWRRDEGSHWLFFKQWWYQSTASQHSVYRLSVSATCSSNPIVVSEKLECEKIPLQILIPTFQILDFLLYPDAATAPTRDVNICSQLISIIINTKASGMHPKENKGTPLNPMHQCCSILAHARSQNIDGNEMAQQTDEEKNWLTGKMWS